MFREDLDVAISTEESSIGRYIDPEIYRAVLDEVHDGLMLADVNGRVVFWNRAAEKITGTRPEEAVGNDCAVLRVSKNNFNDGEGWNAKLVALVAGIDLSVGSVMSLAGCLVATQPDPLWGMVLALLLGLAVGIANGLGVAVAGIHPLIMTLGMGLIV